MKSVCLFLVILITTSYSPKKEPKEQIRNIVALQIQNLLKDLEIMHTLLNNGNGSVKNQDTLISQFKKSRISYKKIEWLHTYLLPEDSKIINGPPLPKLNEATASVIEIEPKGFQVIEQILQENNEISKKEKLKDLIIEISNNVYGFDVYLKEYSFTDRIILEALKSSVIRISFLGITGFDSPLLKFSIEENTEAWISLESNLLKYFDFFNKVDKTETELLKNLLSSGKKYLKENKTFNDFDRFTFIKTYADPVFAKIVSLHKKSGIETISEVTKDNQLVNYNAKSMFAENFLNPWAFSRNKLSSKNDKVIQLGKLLFFDPLMSNNNDRSCASCHNPSKAFSDGENKSFAIGGKDRVERNSPTLINSVFATKYFYDFRINYLEEQIEHVLQDHREFNSSYTEITKKIKSSKEYTTLFSEAFHTDKHGIGSATISIALAQYIRSLTGFNAAFDRQIRGEIKTEPAIKNGFNLFMGKAGCGTCHFAPVFNGTVPPFYNDTESEVLGVPENSDNKNIDTDLGRGRIYKFNSPIYAHSFKTTTVRNASLSGPYMHNGVYKSLEEVMDFYNQGGGLGLGFEVPNQTLPPDKLNLSENEIKDIVLFIKSLTDTTGLTSVPHKLPKLDSLSKLDNRKVGGIY